MRRISRFEGEGYDCWGLFFGIDGVASWESKFGYTRFIIDSILSSSHGIIRHMHIRIHNSPTSRFQIFSIQRFLRRLKCFQGVD